MTDNFLLFCIATVGMTLIITQGGILRPFREFLGGWAERIREQREHKEQATGKKTCRSLVEWFNELINCAQCTGFWCGLFCGLFILYPETRAITAFDDLLCHLLKWFCYGVGGSFLASLGCNAVEWVFYHKMNALRRLEEQDMILAAQRAELQQEQ